MRDPQRIESMLSLIRRVWTKNPDLRLGQLINNCSRPLHDAYYIEDEDLAARLRELYESDED